MGPGPARRDLPSTGRAVVGPGPGARRRASPRSSAAHAERGPATGALARALAQQRPAGAVRRGARLLRGTGRAVRPQRPSACTSSDGVHAQRRVRRDRPRRRPRRPRRAAAVLAATERAGGQGRAARQHRPGAGLRRQRRARPSWSAATRSGATTELEEAAAHSGRDAGGGAAHRGVRGGRRSGGPGSRSTTPARAASG